MSLPLIMNMMVLTWIPWHCLALLTDVVVDVDAVVVTVTMLLLHHCNWNIGMSVCGMKSYQFGVHLHPFRILHGPQKTNGIQEILAFLGHWTDAFLIVSITRPLILGPHGEAIIFVRTWIAMTMLNRIVYKLFEALQPFALVGISTSDTTVGRFLARRGGGVPCKR